MVSTTPSSKIHNFMYTCIVKFINIPIKFYKFITFHFSELDYFKDSRDCNRWSVNESPDKQQADKRCFSDKSIFLIQNCAEWLLRNMNVHSCLNKYVWVWTLNNVYPTLNLIKTNTLWDILPCEDEDTFNRCLLVYLTNSEYSLEAILHWRQ